MTKKSFYLRNVAMTICLAAMAMFSGCEKDKDKEKGGGEYTIEYRPGTHSSGESYTQTKKAGKEIILRDATYTRGGFKQLGWTMDENNSKKYFSAGDTYYDDESLILYPYWQYVSPHYVMPTNVKAEYIEEESTGISNMKVTAIKLGDYYFTSTVAAFFEGIIFQKYYKPEGDVWQEYERGLADGVPPTWIKTPYTHDRQGVEGRVFRSLVADDVIFEIANRIPDGKETIVGIQCNKYVISPPAFGQQWDYTFLFDPVSRLNFKVGLVIDDIAESVYEVKVWDASVTDFGVPDLP